MGFDFEALKVILMVKKMCCTSLEIVDEIKSFGGSLCIVKLGMIFDLVLLKTGFNLNSGFPWEGMDKWSLIFGVTIWKLCKWQNGTNSQGKNCDGNSIFC